MDVVMLVIEVVMLVMEEITLKGELGMLEVLAYAEGCGILGTFFFFFFCAPPCIQT